MRFLHKTLLVLGAGAAVAVTLPSQAGADRVTVPRSPDTRIAEVIARVPRTAYRVDEEIDYKLILQWRKSSIDLRYKIPELPLENLQVISTRQNVESRIERGLWIHERTLIFRLRPLAAGKASVGKFMFEYSILGASSMERTEISSSEFEIRHSRKSLLGLTGYSISGLLGMAAALSLAIGRRKMSRLPGGSGTPSLEDFAIEELERLKAIPDKIPIRNFVSQTGDLFRSYLIRKFELGQAKKSASEVFGLIDRRRDIPEYEKLAIRSILQGLAESQFAGAEPHVEEVLSIQRQITDFISKKRVL